MRRPCTMGEDIKALSADIKEMETASTKAKNVRDDEKTLYHGEQSNFEATITAVGEAIDILKDSKSAALIQTDADTVQKHKAKKARDTALSTAKDSKKEKEGIKGDKESDKATSESTLSETQKALSGDTATLEQTDKECKTVTGEWEQRSAIRTNEIKAIDMAVKILAKVSGNSALQS